MIWQFHHQFRDGHTEMKSQSKDNMTSEEHREWTRDLVSRFPPPENAQNMVCNEKSEFFVWTSAEVTP